MLGSGRREMLTFNGIFTVKYKVVILIPNLYDLLSSVEQKRKYIFQLLFVHLIKVNGVLHNFGPH